MELARFRESVHIGWRDEDTDWWRYDGVPGID